MYTNPIILYILFHINKKKFYCFLWISYTLLTSTIFLNILLFPYRFLKKSIVISKISSTFLSIDLFLKWRGSSIFSPGFSSSSFYFQFFIIDKFLILMCFKKMSFIVWCWTSYAFYIWWAYKIHIIANSCKYLYSFHWRFCLETYCNEIIFSFTVSILQTSLTHQIIFIKLKLTPVFRML